MTAEVATEVTYTFTVEALKQIIAIHIKDVYNEDVDPKNINFTVKSVPSSDYRDSDSTYVLNNATVTVKK